MTYTSDHDGKSKTASAVDHEHYPEQNEVANNDYEAGSRNSRDQVAERAYELWHARGCPDGSPDHDWLEAEKELQAASDSHNVLEATMKKAGSVQR